MLMDFRKALQQFGRDSKKKIQDTIPVATGKTRDSIHYSTTQDSVSLYQRGGWFGALIEGRSPRKTGNDMKFADALKDWMAAVGGAGGLAPTDKGAKTLAFLINRAGTRLFQKKVTSSLDGLTFDTEIRTLSDAVGGILMQTIKFELFKVTKK